jgi:DNA (cytosine-5)-methyltransferase 1
MGLDSVLSDMEAEGYTCWPFIIPACAVDAKHRRDRVWIICHAKHTGLNAAKVRKSLTQGNDGNETRQEQAEQFAGPSEQLTFMADAEPSCYWDKESEQNQGTSETRERKNVGGNGFMADTTSIRRQGQREFIQRRGHSQGGERKADYAQSVSESRISTVESRLGRELNGLSAWLDELGLPKVSSGVPKRADRLKQLGNAVVPQIPYLIGCAIMEEES